MFMRNLGGLMSFALMTVLVSDFVAFKSPTALGLLLLLDIILFPRTGGF